MAGISIHQSVFSKQPIFISTKNVIFTSALNFKALAAIPSDYPHLEKIVYYWQKNIWNT